MRSLLCRTLALRAGLAVSVTAAALWSTEASAQTAFSWASPVDGLWSDSAAWSPMGSPGQFNGMDSALLGGAGAYTVTLDTARTIGTLTISNPDAVLLFESGTAMTVSDIDTAGTIVINDGSSGASSTMTMRDGATLNGLVLMNSPGQTGLAVLNGPFGAGQSAILTATAAVTGVGTLQGVFVNEGLIAADGVGERIRLNTNMLTQNGDGTIAVDNGGLIEGGGTITGGSVVVGSTGTLAGSSSVFMAEVDFAPGSTLGGTRTIGTSSITGSITLASGSSLTLGPGNTFASSLLVNDDSSSTSSTVIILDGATLGGTVVLNSNVGLFRAVVNGPFGVGQSGAIEAGATVSGTGTIQGFIENRGSILADDPGEIIRISSTQLTQTGAGVIVADNGGVIDGTGPIAGGVVMVGPAGTLGGSNTISMADVNFAPGSRVTGSRTMQASVISGTATLASGVSLTLGQGNTYAGTIVVNDDTSSSSSTLSILDGATLGGTVVLSSPVGTARALVNGPFGVMQSGTIAPGATVTGTGQLQGNLNNQGSILADDPGEIIRISSTELTQTGAGVIVADDGGVIDGSGPITGGVVTIGPAGTLGGSNTISMADVNFAPGSRVTGSRTMQASVISGTATLASGVSLTLGQGNTYAGTIVVNDDTSASSSTLSILDGATLGGTVVLSSPVGTARALVNGPFGVGTEGMIAPGATITGTGQLQGILNNAGAINADGPGEEIRLATTGPLMSTGVLRAVNGGRLNLGSGLDGGMLIGDADSRISSSVAVSNAELLGDIVLESGGSLTLGQGNTYAGTITVNDDTSSSSSTVNILDGATLGGTLVLDSPVGTARALVNGPFGVGTQAMVAPGAVITGTGQLQGILNNAGAINADGPGEEIRLATTGPLMSTGVLRAVNGGRLFLGSGLDGGMLIGDADSRIQSGSGVIANAELVGDIVLESGDTLTLGQGNTYAGSITVNDDSSASGSTINILDGATLGGLVVLDSSVGTARAVINGPFGIDTEATVTPGAVITGVGQLQGNIPELPGVLRPGTTFDPGTIRFSISGGTAFADTTELQIGFAGVDPGEFGQIFNTGTIALDGTLRVTALGGFEPLSTNEIEIIDGGTITGTFDAVEYDGNLEPGDVARVFYEPSRVVFAVTCNADTSLPAGVLNIFDVLAFINTWNAQGPGADFNMDGNIDILDVVNFIQLWNTGCPE